MTSCEPALAELQHAAAVIAGGGVVLHATEGVWGFACDPFVEAAVHRILQIKERAVEKGLIVIGCDASTFDPELRGLDEQTRARIEATWPGAVSWVVPNQRFPQWVTGGRQSVAIRVPGHKQARAMARAADRPLVSTSANRSGAPAVVSEADARRQFAGEVDLVLPGAVLNPGSPSVLQTLDGTVLRA